jgi:hypothetical protein
MMFYVLYCTPFPLAFLSFSFFPNLLERVKKNKFWPSEDHKTSLRYLRLAPGACDLVLSFINTLGHYYFLSATRRSYSGDRSFDA